MVAIKEASKNKVSGAGDVLGTGRRKTSVARVRVRAGKGTVTINGRPLDEYFPIAGDRRDVLAPLLMTGQGSNVDVIVRVVGGGPSGQAGLASWASPGPFASSTPAPRNRCGRITC